mmetsp:Transcript_117391/g.240105  ORF Transcript_117391/g.240105 Transcript_117391/m.240105 type:complete len:209 (+) Transcript_117391:1251-1877(+)
MLPPAVARMPSRITGGAVLSTLASKSTESIAPRPGRPDNTAAMASPAAAGASPADAGQVLEAPRAESGSLYMTLSSMESESCVRGIPSMPRPPLLLTSLLTSLASALSQISPGLLLPGGNGSGESSTARGQAATPVVLMLIPSSFLRMRRLGGSVLGGEGNRKGLSSVLSEGPRVGGALSPPLQNLRAAPGVLRLAPLLRLVSEGNRL